MLPSETKSKSTENENELKVIGYDDLQQKVPSVKLDVLQHTKESPPIK